MMENPVTHQEPMDFFINIPSCIIFKFIDNDPGTSDRFLAAASLTDHMVFFMMAKFLLTVSTTGVLDFSLVVGAPV